MGRITVLRPDVADPPLVGPSPLARRVAVPSGAVLTLVDNGKPNARVLLAHLGDALRARLPIAAVEIFSKPAASRPITPHDATDMAARSHLIVTGVGD